MTGIDRSFCENEGKMTTKYLLNQTECRFFACRYTGYPKHISIANVLNL